MPTMVYSPSLPTPFHFFSEHCSLLAPSLPMVDPSQQRRSVIPISLLVRSAGGQGNLLHRHPFADMILPPLQDLRAQLTAAVINSTQQQHHHQPPPPPGLHGYSDPRASSSASPHDHNIDPAIGGGPGGMMSAGAAGDSGGEDSMGDGRKGGKRELSQSKRAAQNRAAQVCRDQSTTTSPRCVDVAPKTMFERCARCSSLVKTFRDGSARCDALSILMSSRFLT